VPQLLMFPDPRPLVERLGGEFFRQLPDRPGVYLMRDAEELVLYVGKAKNLRQRLASYRVANPERMRPRHLRLLRAVARIELQECEDEPAALAREAELLRELKPRFNRAGTWPSAPYYLAWRWAEERLELVITEKPEAGWQALGPRAQRSLMEVRAVLARLLWCARHPHEGVTTLPPGWMHGCFGDCTVISHMNGEEELMSAVERLLAGEVEDFAGRLRARLPTDLHLFAKTAVEVDLEQLAKLCRVRAKPVTG